MSKENYGIHDTPEGRIGVGKQIKFLREEKGLSQEELAQRMGISRTTISKIENGKFSFSIDYLLKLSLSLDFHVVLKSK